MTWVSSVVRLLLPSRGGATDGSYRLFRMELALINDVLYIFRFVFSATNTVFWDPIGSWTLRGTAHIPVVSSYRAD